MLRSISTSLAFCLFPIGPGTFPPPLPVPFRVPQLRVNIAKCDDEDKAFRDRLDAARAGGQQWQALLYEAVLGIDSDLDPLAPALRAPPPPMSSMGEDEDTDFDPDELAREALREPAIDPYAY
jgi:hypothetical protein